MVFPWSLSDSNSPHVSRTLLSHLADLKNAVVWMVSTCPLLSKSSCPCINPLVTVQRAAIIISITITFMFISFFFHFSSKAWYLSFFSLSFNFTLWSAGTTKSTILQVILFCWQLQGLVIWLRLGDQFVSQNPSGVCVSHSPGEMLDWTYNICSYGQTSISCTVPNGSPCPPSHFKFYTLSGLVWWICLFMIDRFVTTSVGLLRLIYSWFHMISPHGVVLSCY